MWLNNEINVIVSLCVGNLESIFNQCTVIFFIVTFLIPKELLKKHLGTFKVDA